MVQTKPIPNSSKPYAIHPLTPTQTRERSPLSAATSSLPLSAPLRRRSLRLAPLSDPSPTTTPDSQADEKGKTFLNLRSGKMVRKRALTKDSEQNTSNDSVEMSDDVAMTVDSSVIPPQSKPESSGVRKRRSERLLRSGKKIMTYFPGEEEADDDPDDSAEKNDDVAVPVDEDNVVAAPESRAENPGASASVNFILVGNNAPPRVPELSRNSIEQGSCSRRNEYMERFREIAKRNAARLALYAQEEEEKEKEKEKEKEEEESESESESESEYEYVYGDDDEEEESEEDEPVLDKIEDLPGPFSTAMKIIRDQGMKLQNAQTSSQVNLCDSISWVPRAKKGNESVGASVPSLQEMCLKILVKNVDAIASLESVPDALKHRLSHLLCDSRKINSHFFELLVRGSPTEIRLRDCSWLTEEQFTECFPLCEAGNLVVLQLDQCGRCLPDYVIVATLAPSRRHLAKLATLSISGACRLSDRGLRALLSSAPALRSINLSQCSLLTTLGMYTLADSLRSLLKELYLDDCQGIDAVLTVPALIKLEHLEVLSVAGIETVSDKFVKSYIVARGQNMKELVLRDCIKLTDASIKVIAEHCPGLCVLDLMNLNKLTDLSVGYLTNGCRAIHTLKLCRSPFSDEAIAAFVETTGRSLKELSLNNIRKVGYHTTLSLANHGKNLHSLDLSWCRNLTNNALGLIVDSCLALRLLKLFGCTQVTDVFLNGHSNLYIQIIGLHMSPVLQHVKVPDPHQGALNYS